MKSALFGAVATGAVFVAALLLHLIVAPSQIDAELRSKVAELRQRSLNRQERQAIADLLQERYESGVAIRDMEDQIGRFRQTRDARRWHAENFQAFEGQISPQELYLYRTRVPDDPSPRQGALGFGIMFPERDLEKLNLRLEKPRLMVARHIEAADGD